LILPLPIILTVVDSGFMKRQMSFFLQIIGFSKVNLTGDIEENFAAFI
jgi:hypothetical protein